MPWPLVLAATLCTLTPYASRTTSPEAPPEPSPEPQRFRGLVEELRIGSMARKVDGFGRVGGLAVSDDGVIWIANEHAAAMLRFSPGRLVQGQDRRAGRRPGRVQEPDGAGFAFRRPCRRLGPGLARVMIFEATGERRSGFPVAKAVINRPRPLLVTDSQNRIWILKGVDLDLRDGRVGAETWGIYDDEGRKLGSESSPDPEAAGPRFTARHYPASVMPGLSTRTVSRISPCGFVVSGRNNSYVLTWDAPVPGRISRD